MHRRRFLGGHFPYRMFRMPPRLSRRLLSAKAHLTGEFTPPSWAFTGSGYISLRAGVCLPLSSHDVAVDSAVALEKPEKTNEPWMWPGEQPGSGNEKPACAALQLPKGIRQALASLGL